MPHRGLEPTPVLRLVFHDHTHQLIFSRTFYQLSCVDCAYARMNVGVGVDMGVRVDGGCGVDLDVPMDEGLVKMLVWLRMLDVGVGVG